MDDIKDDAERFDVVLAGRGGLFSGGDRLVKFVQEIGLGFVFHNNGRNPCDAIVQAAAEAFAAFHTEQMLDVYLIVLECDHAFLTLEAPVGIPRGFLSTGTP